MSLTFNNSLDENDKKPRQRKYSENTYTFYIKAQYGELNVVSNGNLIYNNYYKPKKDSRKLSDNTLSDTLKWVVKNERQNQTSFALSVFNVGPNSSDIPMPSFMKL